MGLFWEIIQFAFYSLLIVAISKYILVPVLRRFAESVNLKAKTVGNLAGVATSVPELLSVSFASVTGLIGTSIYNILSSNIINLIQYLFAIILNKNGKVLKNKALITDLVMVVITILIPLIFVFFDIEAKGWVVPIFLILLVIFYYFNNHMHRLYLNKEERKEDDIIEEEKKSIKGKRNIMIKYFVYLVLTGVLLFVIGNLLSQTLESLAIQFHVPEFVLGIALGFITSLPELITFFESQRHYKKSQEDDRLGVVEATNNLLTSNLLNLFVIQSVGIVLYMFFA